MHVVHDQLPLIEEVVDVELHGPAEATVGQRHVVAHLQVVDVLVLRVDGRDLVDRAAIPFVGEVGAGRDRVVGAGAGDAAEAQARAAADGEALKPPRAEVVAGAEVEVVQRIADEPLALEDVRVVEEELLRVRDRLVDAVRVGGEVAGGRDDRRGVPVDGAGGEVDAGRVGVLRDRVVGVLLPVGLVVVEVGAVLGGNVGARGLVLREVHREGPVLGHAADHLELEALALGVLGVALHLVHHLGLAAGEGGLLGVEAAGVGECVPDVDRVALVEAGEAELALGDGVEGGRGEEEPVAEERELHAVVGGLAGGRGDELRLRGLPRIRGRDVVGAGGADAVGRVEEDGGPAGDVEHAAERARLAGEDVGRRGARIDRGPHAGVGRNGLAGGITPGDADPVLQAVLAVAKGGDEAVLEQEGLRHAHPGAGLAVRVPDVALGAVELAHVDVGDGAARGVLVAHRAGEVLRAGEAEVGVIEDREVREVEALEGLVGAVLWGGVEGAPAGERGALEPVLLEDFAAGAEVGHLPEAGEAEAHEVPEGAFVGERGAPLADG